VSFPSLLRDQCGQDDVFTFDASIDDGVYFSSGNTSRNYVNFVRDVTHVSVAVLAARAVVWARAFSP
jgi:hypothetical protein